MIDYQLEEDEGIILFSEDNMDVYDSTEKRADVNKVLLTNKNLIFVKERWKRTDIFKVSLANISLYDGMPCVDIVDHVELGVVIKIHTKSADIYYLYGVNKEEEKIWTAKIKNEILKINNSDIRITPKDVVVLENGREPVNFEDTKQAFKESVKGVIKAATGLVLGDSAVEKIEKVMENKQDEEINEDEKEKPIKCYCIECGQEIKSTDKFCFVCGTKVVEDK